MPRVGNIVRVLYPPYASNRLGRLLVQEGATRWLVRIERDLALDINEPLLLSLEETEFEVIDLNESGQ